MKRKVCNVRHAALCVKAHQGSFFFFTAEDIHESPYFAAWLQAVIATVAQFFLD